MNIKPLLTILFAVYFLLNVCGTSRAQDQKPEIVVNKLALTLIDPGREQFTVTCSPGCHPVLSALEGDHPRIVLDLNGVASIEKQDRQARSSGRLVKKIRSHLDQATGKLRIVLDMDAAKRYLVSPIRKQDAATYILLVSKQSSGKKDAAGKVRMAKTPQITIADSDRKASQAPVPKIIAKLDSGGDRVSAAQNDLTVEKGRALMNAGDYDGAIALFTRLIEKNPRNSLSYRLRGNAYSNINDRSKAIDDWVTAARLGDKTIQSYLDFLKVPWRQKSKS